VSQERRQAERKAREIVENARKEAAALLAEARASADAVLADAQALSESLKAAGSRLNEEAETLLRHVELTHRELLAELRLPGVAERGDDPNASRMLGERRPGAKEVFELPDWVGRED
jgi:regulator of protease activity HflC (stomatin/prohibitin superfamily)